MSTTSFHFETFDAFSPFSDVGPYRAADYWQLPDGELVELMKGRFVVSPSPNFLHQTIVLLLSRILHSAGQKSGGTVVLSPMDVILSDDTILQPDLLYISKARRQIIKQRVHGSPDLVIEIISDTGRRDRIEKLDLYAMYDVPEYWIIDPQAKHIDFLLNKGGRYEMQTPVADCYQSPRLSEIEIQVAEFWREVDAQMANE
jgi:Uma2 family endonuclease